MLQQVFVGKYLVSRNESVQLRIDRLGIDVPASVVVDETPHPPSNGGIYPFQITPSDISRVTVSAAFPSDAPDDAGYRIFVEQSGGSSFVDRTISKSDPPVTWQHTIRFIVS